ncbi:MAG: XRE family transcriptional regulator [Capnocytophaga sp.]|uniref:XRE family transcriptional regulator n=1 Tax=Capnocytophaga sp. TaxID=44737 RepID=UPI003F9FEAC0
METLARKVKKIDATIYQRVAKQFKTTSLYVGQIARGERKPIRGKGLAIKKELEQLVK